MIAYGEGALWAITGYELDTIERIDPKTNAVVETIPLGRIGETSGWRYRMAARRRCDLGAGPCVTVEDRFHDQALRGERSARPHSEEGSNVLAGDGAVWVANSEGTVLRVDPDSQTVAKTIPLGTLIYPADPRDTLAVGEGSVWVAVTSFAS